MISVSAKFNEEWEPIPCQFLLDSFEYTNQIFDPKTFRNKESSYNIELFINDEWLEKIINARPSFPVLIERDGVLIAGGFADNVFQADEKNYTSDGFLRFPLNIRDFISWFDYELKVPFNPFASLATIDNIVVCDPYNKDKSLLHILFAFLESPFFLSDSLVIPDRTFSFAIEEKGNVLKALIELFYGLGYYFYISPAGEFIAKKINPFPEGEVEDLPFIECYSDFKITRSAQEYTDLMVERADVLHKSRELLKAEKKAIYSEIGDYNQEENKRESLTILVPEARYPANTTPENPYFITPKAEFLQSHYTWDYVDEGIFGSNGVRNEDLSVIAMWRYEIVFNAESAIKLDYQKDRLGSFAFSFLNTNKKPPTGEDWIKLSAKLNYLDVFSDMIYRTKRIKMTQKAKPASGNSVTSLVDVTARPHQATQEILLLYVNDKDTHERFFDLHQSRLKFGHFQHSFSSLKEYELDKAYRHKSQSGMIFTFKIVSISYSINSPLLKYQAVGAFKVESWDKESEENEGGSEKPPVTPIYTVANKWDISVDSVLKTDYTNDESDIKSFDEQAQIFAGQMVYVASVFFIGAGTYKSPTLQTQGSVFRKRPLANVGFSDPSSTEIKVVSVVGASAKGNVNANRTLAGKIDAERTTRFSYL